jgi:Ca-activated chloride channel family protein
MRGAALHSRILLQAGCIVAALGAAVTVVALGTAVSARQQTPFRSGARTVAVYATVTDADGRLVPDLAQDDFEIYDNGKLQPVSVFANDIQPITIVAMFDRSGSMKANFRLVEAAGEAFVERLLPADKARIGSFAARIQVDPRDFTSDTEEMMRILRTELQPDGPTPLWNAVNVGMTALLRQEGRRVVLVFTDGVDEPMNFSTHNVSLHDDMKRAQEEDVMVYAIGLESHVPFGGRRAPLPAGRTGGFRGRQSAMIAQKPDDGLAKIAMETGGGYFELTNTEDLASTFARVADELHRQYALGFEPAKLDGKSHKLELRVKRPGLTARARKSYVASIDRQSTSQ